MTFRIGIHHKNARFLKRHYNIQEMYLFIYLYLVIYLFFHFYSSSDNKRVKLVIVGDEKVGKTSLVQRYTVCL